MAEALCRPLCRCPACRRQEVLPIEGPSGLHVIQSVAKCIAKHLATREDLFPRGPLANFRIADKPGE